MSYFLIQCSEDGDVSVKRHGKEDLMKAIHEEDYGPIKFMDNLDENDPQYWGNKALIIKGEIVW